MDIDNDKDWILVVLIEDLVDLDVVLLDSSACGIPANNSFVDVNLRI